jgi:hypothetical protein
MLKYNQIYFYRVRGLWKWQAFFSLQSFKALKRSKLSFLNKAILMSLTLIQDVFGPATMHSYVDINPSDDSLTYTTLLKKWGLLLFKSVITVTLSSNGKDMNLRGAEYCFPNLKRGVPFEPQIGFVTNTTTNAHYQMPFMGLLWDCDTELKPPGKIKIRQPWMKVTFVLKEDYNHILKQRLDEIPPPPQ